MIPVHRAFWIIQCQIYQLLQYFLSLDNLLQCLVTILGTNACTIVVNNVAHCTVSGQIIIYAISSTVI